MNKPSNKQLEQYLELLDEIPTSDATHLATNSAQKKLQSYKRKKKIVINAFISVALLFLVLCGSVRYSPHVANAIAQIPGMKPFVDMIALDKGMVDILQNNYFEEINASQTINGNTLTVTGVIADEYGLLISYKYESKDDLSNITGIKADLKQGNELIQAGVGYSWSALAENTFTTENTIYAVTVDGIDYTVRDFELTFSLHEHPDAVFIIPFSIQNDIKPSKHTAINEQLEIDGQKFTVHELTVSPIRAQLTMSIDPTNTMKILNFGDIRLLNETGEVWGRIKNGVVGFGSFEDETFSLMLESNYFRTPKSLTIEFSEVEAIHKDDAYIEVDWHNEQILYQPNNLAIELQLKPNYEITYKLTNYKENEFKTVFNNMIDAEGTVYHSNGSWISSYEDYHQIGQTFEITKPPVNPVTLEVARYENYLQGSDSLTISLD